MKALSTPDGNRAFLREIFLIIKLAFPVWIGQLAFTAAGFADAVMSGRAGTLDLAGVAMAASIWVPVFWGLNGLLLSVNPIIAQLFGADKKEQFAGVVQHALLLAFFAGSFIGLLLQFVRPLLEFMNAPSDMIRVSMLYFRGFALGMPAMACYLVLKSFSEAMSDVRPQMYISLMGLLVNVILNFIFIYGYLGFPAMGGAGCGLATALSFCFMFFLMLLYIRRSYRYKEFKIFKKRPFDIRVIKDIFSLGMPISITAFVEASIFGCITLFIGGLGVIAVAGHQIALNISGLMYAFPSSFGIALTVRVGHAVGAEDKKGILLTLRSGIFISLCFSFLVLVFLFFCRHSIVSLYTNEFDVSQLAVSLLIFVALYQISDALMTSSLGALRGFKDTRVPMNLTFVVYWGISFPLGYILAMTDLLLPRKGPAGFWISLIIGLTLAAVVLFLRLLKVSRKQFKLISQKKSSYLKDKKL